jgi:hypothetical protein
MIVKETMQPTMIPAIALDEMDLGDWADAESTPVLLGIAVDPDTGSPLGIIAVVDEEPMEEESEELKASAAAKNCSKVPFPVVLGFSAKTIPGTFLMNKSSKA